MIIDSLRQEHRNIEKLLLVLERELSVFDRGERLITRLSTRLSPISWSIPMPTIIPRGHGIREAEIVRSRCGCKYWRSRGRAPERRQTFAASGSGGRECTI